MNYIQKLIIDTQAAMPQTFESVLRRNQDVLDYINQSVPSEIDEFLEQLYYIVYMEDYKCQYGNRRKLKSWEGYGYCGPAGQCQCASADIDIGHIRVLTADEIAKKESEKVSSKTSVDIDPSVKMNILKDRSMLAELAATMKPHEISQALGVGMSTVYRYLNQHGLR